MKTARSAAGTVVAAVIHVASNWLPCLRMSSATASQAEACKTVSVGFASNRGASRCSRRCEVDREGARDEGYSSLEQVDWRLRRE
jgi:hypothetical protein